jgi:putative NADPH-quinone reductase
MPALVKGMIDRVFLPGFAFKYKKGSALPEQLLKGKSASLIITADTPWWFQKWNRGGLRPLLNSTLRFSGFDIRTIEFFSPVRGSTAEQRQAWIEKVRSPGPEAGITAGRGSEPCLPGIHGILLIPWTPRSGYLRRFGSWQTSATRPA